MIPSPPGITYWRQVTVSTTDGDQKVWAPITQPAAATTLLKLSDEEIASLLATLEHELERRRGDRPDGGRIELAALKVMLASRPPGYLSKLEMFARQPREGWDIWGDEICVS